MASVYSWHGPLSALYLHWASPQGLSALVPWLVAAQPSRTYGLSTQGETTLWGPVPHASPVPGPGLPPHLPSLYAVLPAPHPNTPLTAPSPSLPPHPSSAPSQGMQQRTGLCSWCEGPAPSLFNSCYSSKAGAVLRDWTPVTVGMSSHWTDSVSTLQPHCALSTESRPGTEQGREWQNPPVRGSLSFSPHAPQAPCPSSRHSWNSKVGDAGRGTWEGAARAPMAFHTLTHQPHRAWQCLEGTPSSETRQLRGPMV